LAPQKFVSQSDLDNALAAERSAAAAVQQAKAGVASSRISLDFASVRAPISGRAGKQQVTEGALVGQGDATLLTTIDQLDPLFVNFSISASELDQLRRAQNVSLSGNAESSVSVILADGSAYAQTGTVDFSSTVVDPATGAVQLRARIPNPDTTLLPGSFVTLKATLGEQRDAFLVPQAAIQRDAVSAYAMVVGKDGKVARKNVVTASSRDGQWLISSGLAAGDQVIVSGLQKVRESEPAKATPWKPDAAPAGAPPAAAPKQP
jgi:membrane fusion protein (multidrug efflux system)